MSNFLASEYGELALQAKPYTDNKTYWEKFFEDPLSAQYEAGLSSLGTAFQQQVSQQQQATQYDISGAYGQYKKQQLQLAQQSSLGEGYKAQQERNLRSAYQSAYETYKEQEASAYNKALGSYTSDLLKSTQSYQSALEKEKSDFTKRFGEGATKLEKYILQYGEDAGLLSDTSLKHLETSLAEGGAGIYSVTSELQDDGTYARKKSLSDVGKSTYDEILHAARTSDYNSFLDYLYDVDPEFAAEYANNQDIYEQIVAGVDKATGVFDTSAQKQSLAETISADTTRKKYLENAYGVSFNELSTEDIKDLITSSKDKPDYVGSVTGNILNISGSNNFEDKYGIKWHFDSRNPAYTTVKGFENYQEGDIVYHDDKYCLITYKSRSGVTLRPIIKGSVAAPRKIKGSHVSDQVIGIQSPSI